MRRVYFGLTGGKCAPALGAVAGAAGLAVLLVPALSARGSTIQAETLTIPVIADESVNSGQPNKSYDGNSFRGGLYSGVDGGLSGASRFYLKFDLPRLNRNLSLAHAELRGFYVDDFDPADGANHEIYFVGSDQWSEKSITWANQPGHTFGTPEATFAATFATPGTWQGWDVTHIARQEYNGDGVLSLMMQANNENVSTENRDWEYFIEKEFDPERSFRLELTLDAVQQQPPPSGAPLPAAAWSGAVTAGAIALASFIRRRRRRECLPQHAA